MLDFLEEGGRSRLTFSMRDSCSFELSFEPSSTADVAIPGGASDNGSDSRWKKLSSCARKNIEAKDCMFGHTDHVFGGSIHHACSSVEGDCSNNILQIKMLRWNGFVRRVFIVKHTGLPISQSTSHNPLPAVLASMSSLSVEKAVNARCPGSFTIRPVGVHHFSLAHVTRAQSGIYNGKNTAHLGTCTHEIGIRATTHSPLSCKFLR